MCRTDPSESRRVGAEQRTPGAAEHGAGNESEENPHVQRHSVTGCGAIVGLLVEIGNNFAFKWFHVGALLFHRRAE